MVNKTAQEVDRIFDDQVAATLQPGSSEFNAIVSAGSPSPFVAPVFNDELLIVDLAGDTLNDDQYEVVFDIV